MRLPFSPSPSVFWSVCLFILHITTSYAQISYENAFPNVNFNFPVELQASVDGSNRMFVVEQPGRIKVFQNNTSVTADNVITFLDISDQVAYSPGQEIGLLGLAFHPNYSNNGFVFVYYIDRPNNYRINIARYTVSSTNPNTLDPGSETIIAQFTKNQGDSNHNGGKIAFGPDGYLYASIGDGGGGGDPQGNGQNLNSVFGSILRIDIDLDGNNPLENNPDLPNGNYEIPSDNPRVGQSGLDELYAWGIRNTWKFSFDAIGNLWGADVGQNSFEEINLITKGGNYGWNRFEANSQPSYGSGTSLATSPDIKPIFFYDHSQGDVSITGGYVYRGSLVNLKIQDKYIYADYVTGRVWALEYDESDGSTESELLFRTNGELISSFGEDEDGELYFLGYGASAKIFKLTEEVTGPITTPVNGIGEWETVASGVNGTVETMVESEDGTIYVGGSFTNAGTISVSNLAVINLDGTWSSFGEGSNGTIYSMAIAENGNLYVAGDFTQIGSVNANNIAYWNGTTWASLGAGTNGPISKIAFDETGSLFVGGVFSNVNGLNVNNIAHWNNDTWSALTDATTGITGTNNEIRAMAFDENNILYIGGNFDSAGGNQAARIAQWDGTNWSGLGPGTSGFVQAIAINESYIYAGGNFTLSGSQTVNRVARFNRSTQLWEKLGNGLSGSINSLVLNRDFLYVGGSFETASEQNNLNEIMKNVARWSQDQGWEALGSNTEVGIDNRVNALLFTKNYTELLVGGNFAIAGSIPVNNLAKWAEAFCSENSIVSEYQINGEWLSGSSELTVNEGDTLVLSILPNNVPFTVSLPNGEIVDGDHTLQNVNPEQAGTYLYTTTQGCTKSLRLIVETAQEEDEDNDGVPDLVDICPETSEGEVVDEDGCSSPQLDSDNDGVNDSIDSCPNTMEGEEVDENGCSISTFPPDQFRITSKSIPCINSSNGTIVIESKTTDNFTANLSGIETNRSITFSENLTFDQLQKGTYELCIASAEHPAYSNCSKIIITEPEPLTVQLEMNSSTNSVSLKMRGSIGYTVNINGKSTHTDADELNIQLFDEVNNIVVIPDQDCLGRFEETIFLENTFLIYPNPIGNNLNIDLKAITSETIEIAIFNAAGVLLKSDTHRIEKSILTLNTSSLDSGIYFLRLKNDKINKSFKLVKP